MKNKLLNKLILVTAISTVLVMGTEKNVFMKDANAFTSKRGTVDVSSLNVRSSAETGNNTIATLQRDTGVTVLDELNSDGMYWYKIAFNDGSVDKEGYVAKNYIKTETTAKYNAEKKFESDIIGFPESYRNSLRALHAEYPNWKFVVQNVDISWDEVIKNESVVGVNLVNRSAKSSWKSTAKGAYDWDSGTWPGFDSNEWVAASESIIRYYMDPRNFLDSTNIFQFMNHGYTASEQTVEGVERMLKGTFMESTGTKKDTVSESAVPEIKSDSDTQTEETTEFNDTEHGPGVVNGDVIKESIGSSESVQDSSEDKTSTGNSNASANGSSYVDMIMDAAKSSGVNPYVLSSMLIQEQGVKGTSDLISGKSGIYNFFNIEAYQSGSQSATSRGLAWAGSGSTYLRPWNTKAKAITGGAMYYGSNYAKAGQNSFYLKKFNVLGENKYKHQYMTNVEAAKDEGSMLSRAYSEEDKKGVFTFYIPVYKDMPEVPEAMPSGDGKPKRN